MPWSGASGTAGERSFAEMTPAECQEALVQRYLAAFGPASKRDFLMPGLSAMRGAAILKRSADKLTTM